jgi:hypothetical protein
LVQCVDAPFERPVCDVLCADSGRSRAAAATRSVSTVMNGARSDFRHCFAQYG